jgi:hypothetical protein
MKRCASLITAVCLSVLVTSCVQKEKAAEREMRQPINCATATGDIRVLQSEKAHVAEQVAAGVSSVVPIGLVVGVVTGSEGTEIRMATGEYNRKIDERIAEIRSTCGIR